MCLSSSLSAQHSPEFPSWFLLFPFSISSGSFSEVSLQIPIFSPAHYLLLDLEFPTPFWVSPQDCPEDPWGYQMNIKCSKMHSIFSLYTWFAPTPPKSWMSHHIIAQSFWPKLRHLWCLPLTYLQSWSITDSYQLSFHCLLVSTFPFHCSNSGYFPISHGLSRCRGLLINLSPLKLFPLCPLHEELLSKASVHHTVCLQSFQWSPCQ